MRKQRLILVLLAIFALVGCSESEIVDEREKTTSEISGVEVGTTINAENKEEPEYSNSVAKYIFVESIEMINGEKKYGIAASDMGIPVTDGEVKLHLRYSADYTYDGNTIENENIYNIFLYHNGILHKFNAENDDTYMYTTKVKNGEVLDMEISFKVTDEIESYRVVGVSYNDSYRKDDHGEIFGNSIPIEDWEFKLDLSENTKVFEDDEIMEVSKSCDIEKDNTKILKDIKENNVIQYGVNPNDEFVYKTSDGKYKFGAIRMDESQNYVTNYSTFIICDNEICSAFDGKPILIYKGKGDISLTKEIDLNISDGEHVVYSVTIEDAGKTNSMRSGYAHFNVEK